MVKKLEGKTAVVTGGNSGIGLATAQRFHEEGAKVVISGRDPNTLDQAVKLIGSDALAVRADVSKLADIDKLYQATRDRFGKIDVLFANAGVARPENLAESTEEFYDQIFDINVKGVFFTIQKSLPLLNDGAAIIINSSVANQKGLNNTTLYSATKAAVRSFARTLTAELVGRNIRVNVVSPGPIKTPIFGRSGLSQESQDEIAKYLVSLVPMKRFGTSEEVANAVLFLATSDSSYISGVDLMVDGGMTQV